MTNIVISGRGRAINNIIFHSILQLSVQVLTGKHPHLPAPIYILTSKMTDLEWPMETSLRRKGMRLSCRRSSRVLQASSQSPAKQELVRAAATKGLLFSPSPPQTNSPHNFNIRPGTSAQPVRSWQLFCQPSTWLPPGRFRANKLLSKLL